MQRISTAALLVAGSALFFGCTPAAQGPSEEEMLAAANALDEAFVDAFNRGDAEAMSALFWNSEETVSFPPDILEARGISAIREANAKMVEEIQAAKLELSDWHQMPAGEYVIGWGLWKMTIPGPEGETIEMTGRYSDVKAERDGKWVYVMDHASAPLPPMPAEE